MKWRKFCKEQAEKEQIDRQWIQKTEATLFPDGLYITAVHYLSVW